MGVLEFIDALVGHLAWPVVAVIALILFRGRLRHILDRVVKGKVGPGGIEFETAWERAYENVTPGASASPPPEVRADEAEPRSEAPEPHDPIKDFYISTAPEQALFGAYRRISDELRTLIANGKTPPFLVHPASVDELGHQARTKGIITDDTLRSLRGLHVMYQLAMAKPEEVTPKKAQEFQTLVNALLYVLEVSAGN